MTFHGDREEFGMASISERESREIEAATSPAPLRASGPFLVNPRYRGRAITLTFDQFKYGWANALDEDEAKSLHEAYHVAGSGIALAQMGNANLNPWTESKVDTKNPDRGPLLILDGEKTTRFPGRSLTP